MRTCVGPIPCLVDKMADFTSLLFESKKNDSSSTGVCLDLQKPFLATRGKSESFLRGWDQCGPAHQLGEFKHKEEIDIAYIGGRSTMKIRHRLPWAPRPFPTSSKTSFSVEILDFQLV